MAKNKRDQIMDAAERLFARNGFYGVSVRDITSSADVRLASVNYYFETKEKLYFEVLARRADYIVKERERRLDNLDFDSMTDSEAIAAIVRLISSPIQEKVMSGDVGWRAYLSVLAHYSSSPLTDDKEAPPMNDYDRYSLKLIAALRRYTVDDSEQKAQHAFQFITGSSLMIFANNGRLNTLSNNKYRSDDYPALYEDGMEFMIGGTVRLLRGA